MEKNPLINQNSVIKHRITPQRTEECLQLTGSQMNLTSRSQKSVLRSPKSPHVWKFRPCSAYPCSSVYNECKSGWKRPMSADNDSTVTRMKARSNHFNTSLSGCSPDEVELLVPEQDPNFRHCYTYMSSNLLRSLIKNPWNSDCSESMSNTSDLSNSERSLGSLIREMAQNNSDGSCHDSGNCLTNRQSRDLHQFQGNGEEIKKLDDAGSSRFCREKVDHPRSLTLESASKNNLKEIRSQLNDLKFQKWFQCIKDPKTEEKIVRFSQEQKEIKKEQSKSPILQTRPELEYNPKNFTTLKDSPRNEEDISRQTVITENEENGDPKSDYETFAGDTDVDTCHYRRRDSEKTETDDKEMENGRSCSDNCPFSCCITSESESKYQTDEEKREIEDGIHESETNEKSQEENEENESLVSTSGEKGLKATTTSDTTYDEIVTIINVLEQEETNSLLHKEIEEKPEMNTTQKNEQLQNIYSYLDEVEKSSQETINVAKNHLESVRTSNSLVLSNVSSIPRLEELLNKNPVELAHEVLALKLQIEDQSSGIKLLQNTIAEMKEAAKLAKNNHEDEIFKVTNEADMTVQRHQKFIKQLLQEKKTLNEKVGKLVEDLKSGEERYQRNLKTIEERHAIEIQRVKETQAVAEKLKREKWIDIKTQKIKEMTVKGLEPELSRMQARQQQEIADLRNLHRSELEAVELRATRRTTELLEELRSELSKDKEEAILRETNALRAKLEKQFEEERSKFEHEARKLRDERRRDKEILESKEAQMQDTYQEMKRALEREKERERQHVIQEYQEQIEGMKRRHQNEIKSVRDTLEIEKEAWMNNFKKQQNAKFLEREAELHHQYKRERDRDIELVIERLENESTQAQQELSQAAENKIRRMREKYEQEIKEMETTEATLKAKLSDTKAQMLEKDDRIADLNSQVHHLQTDLNHIRKLCEEMSTERGNIKEIIGKEFEVQIIQAEKEQEELKSQIAALKTNHILELAKKDQLAIQAKAEAQRELNQVYNRVKITVSKKEEALEALREQHKTALERCSHLEKMLENQRRNLLLK